MANFYAALCCNRTYAQKRVVYCCAAVSSAYCRSLPASPHTPQDHFCLACCIVHQQSSQHNLALCPAHPHRPPLTMPATRGGESDRVTRRRKRLLKSTRKVAGKQTVKQCLHLPHPPSRPPLHLLLTFRPPLLLLLLSHPPPTIWLHTSFVGSGSVHFSSSTATRPLLLSYPATVE